MQIIKHIIAALMVLFAQFQLLPPGMDTAPKDMGIPTEESYAKEQRFACSVWDMAVRDGILYIGSGDYSANTGPTPIWSYSIEDETWSIAATVMDESVSRFCVVGDSLIAPGIDATGTTWKYGNYHTLSDGQWISFSKLPGAVHSFDVTYHKGQYFFGLGTADGKTSPVLISADGQSDFQPVPFYMDEELLLDGRYSFTRVYDFFVTGDNLFCLLCCYTDEGTADRAFCRYEDGRFRCTNEAELSFGSWKQLPVMGKAALDGVQYFTTGTLYKTTDFSDITPIEMPDAGTVTDLYTYDLGQRQLLYALSNVKNEDGTYTATVYRLGEEMTAEASYTSSAPALSFVRSGMFFYLGLGGGEKLPDTGRVIRLSTLNRLCNP